MNISIFGIAVCKRYLFIRIKTDILTWVGEEEVARVLCIHRINTSVSAGKKSYCIRCSLFVVNLLLTVLKNVVKLCVSGKSVDYLHGSVKVLSVFGNSKHGRENVIRRESWLTYYLNYFVCVIISGCIIALHNLHRISVRVAVSIIKTYVSGFG